MKTNRQSNTQMALAILLASIAGATLAYRMDYSFFWVIGLALVSGAVAYITTDVVQFVKGVREAWLLATDPELQSFLRKQFTLQKGFCKRVLKSVTVGFTFILAIGVNLMIFSFGISEIGELILAALLISVACTGVGYLVLRFFILDESGFYPYLHRWFPEWCKTHVHFTYRDYADEGPDLPAGLENPFHTGLSLGVLTCIPFVLLALVFMILYFFVTDFIPWGCGLCCATVKIIHNERRMTAFIYTIATVIVLAAMKASIPIIIVGGVLGMITGVLSYKFFERWRVVDTRVSTTS
jgi:hypothetical protein